MYETEANHTVESIAQIPSDVLEKFLEFRGSLISRSLLPWSEHCTECVWPTCYTTCDLYSPRQDGRCRRFVDGTVRLECPGAASSYLVKIRFKRWAKLWAPGNLRLFSLVEAERRERRDRRIGSVLYQLPLPTPARNFATAKRYSWKKRLATNSRASTTIPNLFVIECFNPSERAVSMSLTIRSSAPGASIPYQKLFQVVPGFHREITSVEEIARRLTLDAPFSIDLTPNDVADGTTLYFGLIDFVKSKPEAAATKEKQQRVKCIVWDLDNTLWDGTLVEDGSDKIALKAGVVEIIKELDQRGILHSVASKNNFEEAMAVLRRWNLEEYFLHPEISWDPKGGAIKRISAKLNIGVDTLMLIDDSEFELAQVQAACPGVQTLRADQCHRLPDLEACQGPVTQESASRRGMYQLESVRASAAESFAGDYLGFLRECQIEMQIEPLSEANMERVYELTQRTNQMNFSGNRYERTFLEQIVLSQNLDTYVISCRDRFGSYGVIGFSVVDTSGPRMIDLMFSCRIQAKRVEHAFLAYLLSHYAAKNETDFWANYRKAPRNEPSGRVFQDMGFEPVETRDGVTSLVFRKGQAIPDDGVIQIVEMTRQIAVAR
jgi:FkbH-like protein